MSARGCNKRVCLEGGGCKPLSVEMEELVLDYILDRRMKGLHVSGKLVKAMYEEICERYPNQDAEKFEASKGWVQKFMQQSNLSLRHPTSVAQKDPNLLASKVVSYILRVRRLRKKFDYHPADIVAFDETPIWADMI